MTFCNSTQQWLLETVRRNSEGGIFVSIYIVRSGYYHQPMTLIDAYKFSFFPSTIKLWNQLPADVINSSTPNEFCNNLSNFYDHTCAL